jgi:hypothetical protein
LQDALFKAPELFQTWISLLLQCMHACISCIARPVKFLGWIFAIFLTFKNLISNCRKVKFNEKIIMAQMHQILKNWCHKIWWMDGGWMWNTFPLGSSSLANRCGYLTSYFFITYLVTSHFALTYLLTY